MTRPAKGASRKARAGAAPLRIDGDMTIYQAGELKQRLLEMVAGAADNIALDLDKVGEIDTAGVQLLIAARNAAAARGRTLTVTASSRAVAEVLELFALGSTFADAPPAAA